MASAVAICGWCEEPVVGSAQIGDVWYCHPDGEGPSCYQQALFDANVRANDAHLFKVLGIDGGESC